MGGEGEMECGRGIPIEGVWLVANAASNKRMQWSAASESRIVKSVLCAAPTDAGRYTLWRVSEVDFRRAKPRSHLPVRQAISISSNTARARQWLAARARLLLRPAHNKCVQRSAASEFLILASMLHAAPADASR